MSTTCLQPKSDFRDQIKPAKMLHELLRLFTRKIEVINRKEADIEYFKRNETRPNDEIIFARWLNKSSSSNGFSQTGLWKAKDLASLKTVKLD